MRRSTALALVYYDRNREVCIQATRDAEQVQVITLNGTRKLRVLSAEPRWFDAEYKPMLNYPVAKAAKTFLRYAESYGMTIDAEKWLTAIWEQRQHEIPPEPVIEPEVKKRRPRKERPIKLGIRFGYTSMITALLLQGHTDRYILKQVQTEYGIENWQKNQVGIIRGNLHRKYPDKVKPCGPRIPGSKRLPGRS
jgi:hypothetical protein